LKKINFFLIALAAAFLLIRLFGLHFSYFQDEYKWPLIAQAGFAAYVPHPPLTQLIFVATGRIFGEANFRLTPLIFGFLNLFLIYWLVKNRFGQKAAFWSSLFFVISFYSVLASLMVDTDGQILPFFFILSLVFYYKWRQSSAADFGWLWLGLVICAAVLGFLVKLSFALAIGAIALDFLYEKKDFFRKKIFWKYLGWLAGLSILLMVLLIGINQLFPYFDFAKSFSYWKHFFVLSGRNYLQVAIEFLKAIFYTSPILVLPAFFLKKETANKLRIFFFFLALGLIFYLVLFDFSSGALDRYFQFLIVPLAIISGVAVAEVFSSGESWPLFKYVVLGLFLSFLSFLTQYLPHFVPPLYPKAEWFSRALHFKWNFLFPFMGGSGPVGFYVSWLFISFGWLAAIGLVILAFFKKNWRKPLLVLILSVGFIYNVVFVEEYLFGRVNGNSNILLKDAINFIASSQNIKQVRNYNDIGGYELMKIGKYLKRLYVNPGNEAAHRQDLSNDKGNYFVIDIPRLNPASMYMAYFNSCAVIYQERSAAITSRVYDCKNAIDLNE